MASVALDFLGGLHFCFSGFKMGVRLRAEGGLWLLGLASSGLKGSGYNLKLHGYFVREAICKNVLMECCFV